MRAVGCTYLVSALSVDDSTFTRDDCRRTQDDSMLKRVEPPPAAILVASE